MTPAHTDSPLRRSEVGLFREGNQNVTINDDEEERREARRRTILRQSNASDGSTFEENETLKKCLEIYNGNKLSRDNAWSMSLIDTLSTLLDRHHKTLNNFKVAGSSLEASSKVYGLRVDSIHIDVMRMSAGLNAQKFNEKNLVADDDDDVGVAAANTSNDNADPNSTSAGDAQAQEQNKTPAKKPKRQRKAVSTITKNKETLNARLDTVPLQDPVFGKLNSVVGSINSSNRLMSNILLTTDSELRLRTNFPFWDSSTLEKCDFTEEVTYEENIDSAACDRLFKVLNFEDLQLRPTHGGYVISDTPEIIADDKDMRRSSLDSDNGAGDGFNTVLFGGDGGLNNEIAHNPAEMSMAFDINAECEPLPPLNEHAPMLDVDFEDFEELTTEERTAINNCRGLRKAPLLLEDLRPVDASSKLEYSYRPLDKISQFWAGPSHWKFKRRTTRPSAMHQDQQVLSMQDGAAGRRNLINQRAKRTAARVAKQRSKQLNFGEYHDDLFIKLDDKYKARKANIQKKWDQRKLKLPTDLQMDPMQFFKYSYAPGVPVEVTAEELQDTTSPDLDGGDHQLGNSIPADHHFGDDDDDVPGRSEMSIGGANLMNISAMSASGIIAASEEGGTEGFPSEEIGADGDNIGNNTVLEIATDFEGAPSQVTKIIVPFAKRAKVIDMKNLKRCCTQLLTRQMKRHVEDAEIPQLAIAKEESYAPGMASFKVMYDHLPELLTQNMTEALSPSIAFYSVLHLANDLNLRLIPQEDLEDFKIRQVML